MARASATRTSPWGFGARATADVLDAALA